MRKCFLAATVAVVLFISGCGSSKETTASNPAPSSQSLTSNSSEAEAKKKAEDEAKKKAEEEANKKASEQAAKVAEEAKKKYKYVYFFMNEIPRIDKDLFGNNDEFIPQESFDFLADNFELFPAWKPELIKTVDQKVDKKITYKHLEKNISKYLDKFIRVEGYIVDIQEYPSEVGDASYIHLMTDSGENFIFLYPGTGELFKQDHVVAVGVPVRNTSFDNISGGKTRCVMIAGSYIRKMN